MNPSFFLALLHTFSFSFLSAFCLRRIQTTLLQPLLPLLRGCITLLYSCRSLGRTAPMCRREKRMLISSSSVNSLVAACPALNSSAVIVKNRIRYCPPSSAILLFSGVGTRWRRLQARWLHLATACHTTSSLLRANVSLRMIVFISSNEMSSNSSLSRTCFAFLSRTAKQCLTTFSHGARDN